MPVVIGAKPESTFADPAGLLGDCHRRIERFLAVLERIVREARGAPLSVEQARALETALRYFREAAPKHTADEEISLFPRLRRMGRPEVQALLDKVDALEMDHVRAGQAHDEADRLGRLWLEAGSLPEADAGRLAALIGTLSGIYRHHIAIEEAEVFPLAALLGPEELKAVGEEMAARRGVPAAL
jgi:hemerythrin-like domain-containing protein